MVLNFKRICFGVIILFIIDIYFIIFLYILQPSYASQQILQIT